MSADIAEFVINLLNDTEMNFVDSGGKPGSFTVTGMRWNEEAKRLEKRFLPTAGTPSGKGNADQDLERMNVQFYANVSIVLGQEPRFNDEDVNEFLRLANPTSSIIFSIESDGPEFNLITSALNK